MTAPVESAVVVARDVAGASPLDVVAGLPLVLRTVLSLQKEGILRMVVAADAGGVDAVARVLLDDRVKARVHVQGCTWREALGACEAPAIVAMHHVVVDPAVYRALRAQPIEEHLALIATAGRERLGPFLAAPELARVCDEATALPAGLPEAGTRPVEVAGAWAARVDTPEGRRAALFHLFEACRKPVDGIVARRLNRHISLFLSKRIVDVPITPNAITLITFGVAIAAAWSASRGGYGMMLLGAFLLQCASILDGVDGELARVRFQHSKVGQWLDTVCDDASNILFYSGVAIGSRDLPWGQLLVLCGAVGVVATALTCAQYYAELVRLGSGDFYAIEWQFDREMPRGFKGAVVLFFKYATKKDFFILMFLGFALAGVLPYVLPVVAIGALVTVGAATYRNVARLFARASA